MTYDSPLSIKAALEFADSRLEGKTGSPGLDAEVLLTHTLERDRAYLRTWPERSLTAEQQRQFVQLVSRRVEGVPVSYLTGEREFWSRSFVVRPGVLIPRPDTELLIELALDLVPDLCAADILELGTGSGIIAVTLAAERPQATITATDLSQDALETARLNASRQGVRSIEFLHGSWFEPIPPRQRFDLIVSNPPYIAEQDPHLSQGDLRFEPLLALASGPDGLDAIRQIAKTARPHLKSGAALLLEHGYQQALPVAAILEGLGYSSISHHLDLQGHQRATLVRYP